MFLLHLVEKTYYDMSPVRAYSKYTNATEFHQRQMYVSRYVCLYTRRHMELPFLDFGRPYV